MCSGDFFKITHLLPVYHQWTDAIPVIAGQTLSYYHWADANGVSDAVLHQASSNKENSSNATKPLN
jgi:hypothetical protein